MLRKIKKHKLTQFFASGLVVVIMLAGFSNGLFADETVSISAQVNSPSGGGGGGGGGSGSSGSAHVHITGRAYPLSRVTVLRDSRIAATTIAGPDARFDITVDDVPAGNMTFGVYGTDSSGRNSETFSFPLMVADSVTIEISGVFIAPTLAADKSQVMQGDNITFFGQALASSNVVISVHSAVEQFHTVTTDTNGAYLLTLDTSPLEIGNHEAKSKTVLATTASTYGKIVPFKVSTVNIPTPTCTVGDINCDGKVNIVDFSIMAYWYSRANPPENVDLNHDSTIALVDFSILAYHWTG